VGQFMPGLSVGAIVTADRGVVVERSMRFGEHQRGADDQVGVTSASSVWLFAQGDTSSGRQTFLTVLNPNQATLAAVAATFYGANGRPVGATTILVDALRRGNIKVNDVLPNSTVAVVVTSNVPVVVESPQYEGPADLNRAVSGTDVFGQNGGAASWLFPSGSLNTGSEELMYLFNTATPRHGEHSGLAFHGRSPSWRFRRPGTSTLERSRPFRDRDRSAICASRALSMVGAAIKQKECLSRWLRRQRRCCACSYQQYA
jgi:hypothetical protein